MNNPDERSAIEQFGKGDKYFGVAVMMATMPGLPMFGHGQIEGFAEKYGMEYRRAYWNEKVDDEMVRRHEREIFPLLKRRHLFSHVENFVFYDFNTIDGHVDENVFAYSNASGNDGAIVLYNNTFNTTRGWIHSSTAINMGSQDEPRFVHKSLAEALSMRAEDNRYYIFRDHRDGLEYIRSGSDLAKNGLYVELYAYHYCVFLDFREVFDLDGSWGRLAHSLNGTGVQSMESRHRTLQLRPVIDAFARTVTPDILNRVACPDVKDEEVEYGWRAFENSVDELLDVAGKLKLRSDPTKQFLEKIRAELEVMRTYKAGVDSIPVDENTRECLLERYSRRPRFHRILGLWSITRSLGDNLFDSSRSEEGTIPASSWIDEWMLADALVRAVSAMGGHDDLGQDELAAKAMLDSSRLSVLDVLEDTIERSSDVFEAESVRDYLGFNEFGGVTWLSKEQLETFTDWTMAARTVECLANAEMTQQQVADEIEKCFAARKTLLESAEKAGYNVTRMIYILDDLKGVAANSKS
ncbi:hypothetical protein ACFL1X_12885, partial [Candidatus Hydrogenedentota bacterium]